MNRRHFLRNSSLAGITLSTTALSTITGKASAAEQPAAPADDFLLNETTIDLLQQKMQSGALTSVAITNMYLQRIQAIDKSGPHLNAVIEINPDAVSIAAAMDGERKAGKVRGPLHG